MGILLQIVQDRERSGYSTQFRRWIVSDLQDPVHHLLRNPLRRMFPGTRKRVQHLLILQRATADPTQPFLHPGSGTTGGFCQLLLAPFRVLQPERPEFCPIGDPLFFHTVPALAPACQHRCVPTGPSTSSVVLFPEPPRSGGGYEVGKQPGVTIPKDTGTSVWVNNTSRSSRLHSLSYTLAKYLYVRARRFFANRQKTMGARQYSWCFDKSRLYRSGFCRPHELSPGKDPPISDSSYWTSASIG